ncbi:hypothetical protein Daus18300_013843 [Diaporthe australafricana]|uniref:Xylanolytic transcriptional activator regulatory domain-containing protein n=1 Tax=Diaporthe australafricana TaxID=127596 RepID=A0ABR3VXL5_9PEZI
MDKLSRLEHIIKRLASEDKGDAESTLGGHTGEEVDSPDSKHLHLGADGGRIEPVRESSSELSEASGDKSSSLETQFGRLVINDSMSYYVGNVLWANLANEVDGIREMVHEAEEDESDDGEIRWQPPATSEDVQSGSNASLFGFRAIAYSLQSYHPTMSEAINLFALFTENVSPVIRLFHMPTMSRTYREAITSLDALDKNTEALLFAIYYSTCISLSNEQCLALFNATRDAVTEKYRFATEQALAKANLLNTNSMVLLQAAVLFLSALRNQDDSRTTWSLTALVFYIAQSMGLHRDGTVFGLKPFETELRRRLWWYICVLDGHSSKYQEHEANLHQFFSDTKLPLHVNDADLHPDMTEAPQEKDGWTDMTFCLVRCEAIHCVSTTKLIGPGLQKAPYRAGQDDSSTVLPMEERKRLVEEFVERLTTKYLLHCDPSEPVLLMSALVIKLIFARFWLLVYRPQAGPKSNDSGKEKSPTPKDTPGTRGTTPSDQEPRNPLDPETRDKLFTMTIEVIELSTRILTDPKLVKWSWYSSTYVQWHAIGYVLAEICCRPPSAECDRAWNAAVGVYESGILRMNEPKGTVWRPIKRLMDKARYVREMQGLQQAPEGNTRVGSGMFAEWNGPRDAGGVGIVHGGSASSTALHTDSSGPSIPGLLPAASGDDLLYLLNLPDDTGLDDMDDFGMSEGNGGFSLNMMGAGSAMDGWDGRMW